MLTLVHVDMLLYRHVGGHHGLGGRRVEEEAVGGRDHVLGGHQRAATQVAAGADQHHPGVLVPLESYAGVCTSTRNKVQGVQTYRVDFHSPNYSRL